MGEESQYPKIQEGEKITNYQRNSNIIRLCDAPRVFILYIKKCEKLSNLPGRPSLKEEHLFVQVKQRQSEVLRILDGNHMKYELVDVSISENLLQEMRDKAGNPEAIPPQIFNGEQYCGVRSQLFLKR